MSYFRVLLMNKLLVYIFSSIHIYILTLINLIINQLFTISKLITSHQIICVIVIIVKDYSFEIILNDRIISNELYFIVPFFDDYFAL